jgi:hypothetical protein
VDRKTDPSGNHLLRGFPRLGARESHYGLIGKTEDRDPIGNWEVVEGKRKEKVEWKGR